MSEQAERVERLVSELIATGTLWPETQADLERFVAEAKAGTLWADDLNYLVALHAKVVLGAAPQDGGDDVAEPPVATDRKFEEIKRRFAERYHPDTGSEADPALRAKIFEEFWPEFDAVDAAE